jgi:hypothetical protein
MLEICGDPASTGQMQRNSDEYRHKAAECARKALASHERSIRDGYAEAARRWRKLAEKTEASGSSESSPPPPSNGLILFRR